MSGPELSHGLRALLRELAEADVSEVLATARDAARERAARVLEDGMFEELLAAAARRREPERAAPRRDPGAGEAWWAYCVLGADDVAAVPHDLEGVEPGSPVEVIVEGPLAALASPVPSTEYDDERLRARLEDIAWVERVARGHEAVLDRALAAATIVPLRLCTIFRDRAGVHRLLAENARSLADGLARVHGCAEWAVKLFAERDAGRDPDAAAPGAAFGEQTGAAYLAHCQQERARAELAREARGRCAEAVHARVSEMARAATRNPPQPPELHRRELPMLLNGAYLIDRAREQELHETVQALRDLWEPSGFEIELTGPWPAYNFVAASTGVIA